MVNYGSLSPIETAAMAIIVIVTNFAGLPTCFRMLKIKGNQFEGMLMFMSLCSSFMYHTCETFNTDIFIEELQWHRMDNIFVISSFSTYLLYLSGNIEYRFLVHSTLIVGIISQEKDPWNINYSVFPIVFYGVLGFCLRIYNINKHRVIYNWNYLGISLALTTVGVHFFAKGLDEFDDYLRFNHSVWHLVIGVSSWYGFQSTRVEPIQRKSDKIKQI